MNSKNLHALINKYEENFYLLNNVEHDEIFKWRAAKKFRDEWFSLKNTDRTFSEMFIDARKEMSVLVDNSRIAPSNGVVKVAEKNQDAVTHLFKNVLFADDNDDITKRQQNLDTFVYEFNKLCLSVFPTSYMFKQNRHSASVYLIFYNPESNFIYKPTEADTFAQYIEFGKDIGFGDDFSLKNYYEMCNLILNALQDHQSLIEKHFAFLNDDCYKDNSLHLLVSDIIFCSIRYEFYIGLEHVSKKDSIKTYTMAEARAKERLVKEAKVNDLERRLNELKMKADEYAQISLLGVEISHPKYGNGTVIGQEINVVDVLFANGEKSSFEIHRNYVGRGATIIDGDNQIVESMSEYGDLYKEIEEVEYMLAQAKRDLKIFEDSN